MVQLIRSPSQGRDEAAESMQSRNSELDKQALRERIERKRQDDLVRRREFTYLRKMRAHYPSWDISVSLDETVRQIVAAWQRRPAAP